MYREYEVVGAIRLALEAGANARTKLKAIEALVNLAPPTEGACTGSVAALVDAMKEIKAEWVINDEGQRIEKAPA